MLLSIHSNTSNTKYVSQIKSKIMTRKEFIQQAVISMAGKVIGSSGVTTSGVWANVVNEADKLADKLESHGYEF
jgi:hypothetical protein